MYRYVFKVVKGSATKTQVGECQDSKKNPTAGLDAVGKAGGSKTEFSSHLGGIGTASLYK